MTTYKFSYHIKRLVPHIKRRPWWNLFGKDSIEYKEQWVRTAVSGLTKEEGELLIVASCNYWKEPLGVLLLRLIGVMHNVQLEVDKPTNPYISCVTNYMTNSRDNQDVFGEEAK